MSVEGFVLDGKGTDVAIEGLELAVEKFERTERKRSIASGWALADSQRHWLDA